MSSPKVRNRWSLHDSILPSLPSDQVPFPVQKQFKQDCDVNFIVEKAMRGIQPSFLNSGVPQYGDFSETPTDFADAFNLVQEATAAFNALPAALRLELGNDPTRLAEITLEQADKYGLLKSEVHERLAKERDEAHASQASSHSNKPAKGAGKPPKGAAPTQPGKASEGHPEPSANDEE